MRRLLLWISCPAVCAGVGAQPAAPPSHRPGAATRGETLLPNGWRIAPAGRSLSVGDLPLSMLESPDGRYLVVANNGYLKPSLTVVGLQKSYVRSKFSLDNAWLGLAWHPDGKRLYCSGAAALTVADLQFTKGRLTAGNAFSPGQTDQKTLTPAPAPPPPRKTPHSPPPPPPPPLHTSHPKFPMAPTPTPWNSRRTESGFSSATRTTTRLPSSMSPLPGKAA